jgi:hypothetical protein
MAKVTGQPGKTYHTGKPCPQGHVALRYTANGTCVECNKRTLREWVAGTGKLKAKAKDRRNHLKKNYGITVEDFDALLAKQNGRCAICGTDDPPRYKSNRGGWHVDHDHSTGRVRGVLCPLCNVAIGHFKEDVNRMSNAIKYILTA